MGGSEKVSVFSKRLQEERKQQNPSFQELAKSLDLKAREKGIPISGKFELTPLCNFNCRMCYVHLNEKQLKGRSVLSVETWKSLMYQAWKAGMITAGLSGGECLAYPGFRELYLYLHSLGCEVGIITNGFLLDDKWIQFFLEHMPAGIQITLYGCNDDVYERVTGQRAFTRVTENIRQAINSGLPVRLSITPSVYLGEDLLETVRIAKEICRSVTINSCFVLPREETGRSGHWDDADTDLYIRALQYCRQLDGLKRVPISEEKLPPCGGPYHETSECGFLCGGGRSGFAIDWEGAMMPCVNFAQIRSYPLKDGFTAAWSKVNYEANHWPRIPECNGCAYETVCDHCASNALQYAEPGKVPTPICERTREMIRNGVFRLPDCE